MKKHDIFFASRPATLCRVMPTVLILALTALLSTCVVPAAEPTLTTDLRDSEALVGVATVDVTPDYPVRLNGFGGRRTESEGVTQRIFVKALAIGDSAKSAAVLVTMDNLGIPDEMTREVGRRLAAKVGLDPQRLTITFTHTHTAPMLRGASSTIFSAPIPPDHQARIDKYTAQMTSWLEEVVTKALAARVRSRLSWGVGRTTFAVNRRTPRGPVDHDLPVLVVRDLNGKVRAVYTTYACHCVTFGHNQISGDWAGYAAAAIEQAIPGTTAMISIGCGADSNPDSGVTQGNIAAAQRQGEMIRDEVQRLLAGRLAPVQGTVDVRYQRIELPLAPLPPREFWERRAGDPNGHIALHAKAQLARLERGEKLRTAVDYPVQTWRFGDDLALVFLAGEVVVDYAARLKRELAGDRVWVHGYTNDFPFYIPSERILREGGYEGGEAYIYFDQPAKFAPGLEQKVIDAVRQQIPATFHAMHDSRRTGGTSPRSPAQSLAAIRIRPGMTVELVAAEPLVVDPVAIDFGPDGRLWVAEMHDYPQGVDGRFKPGGRVKVLTDSNGDGRYDAATTFLDGVPFPTDVKVWRQGVLVCAAPDILYAEDTTGDGRADVVKKLFTGFATHNYQARVNSLQYALDNWLYASTGLFGGRIVSHTGRTIDLTSRDFRLRPDAGELEPVTGQTQQSRVRDDWDNWFGCDSGQFIRHYPVVDRYVRRQPQVAPPPTAVPVANYPESNRLYPVSPLVTFKLSGPPGYATAACGVGIYRDELLGPEFYGNSFTCEPVCQVVHRLVLTPDGVTFRGRRAADEQQSEFLASSDNWFRPVQARTGPDGALWIVDMYRYVIEHPIWIPPDVVATLDVRAGDRMGRIYRVFPTNQPPRPMVRLDRLDAVKLAAELDSPNGPQRDLVQQLLVWRGERSAADALAKLSRDSSRPQVRAQALATLDGLGALTAAQVRTALADSSPHVRRQAVRLAERFLSDRDVVRQLVTMTGDADPQVRLQLAYTLGEIRDAASATTVADALATLALDDDDAYIFTAALSSLQPPLVPRFTKRLAAAAEMPLALWEAAVELDHFTRDTAGWQMLLDRATRAGVDTPTAYYPLVARLLERGAQHRVTAGHTVRGLDVVLQRARRLVVDDKAVPVDRALAVRLLGLRWGDRAADKSLLAELLSPRHPLEVQRAVVAQISRFDDPPGADFLVKHRTSASPAVQPVVIDALLSRPAWAARLLDELEAQRLRPGELDAARRQRLAELGDATQRARAAKLLAVDAPGTRADVVARYASSLTTPGDRARGRELFAKHCAACHRSENVGHAVGPDLAPLATKPPATLLLAILDPNQAVDPRYVSYVARTTDGQVVTGLLASETAASVTLLGQDGKQQVLLRGNLEALQSSGKSLMPEGVERELAPTAVADVLAYLALGPPAKSLADGRPQPIQFVPAGDKQPVAAPKESPPDLAELAKIILNDKAPAAEREKAVGRGASVAPELVAKLTAGLLPADAKEEYRRIPWIWRVAVAAGKRNDAPQLKALLATSLPRAGESLRDWQAVVIGGGVVHGTSLAGAWPRDRVAEILQGNADLTARWQRTLDLASPMADDAKVPHGTRYDALRMLGVDTWQRRGTQLVKYLAKETNEELQMGAVSGLGDMQAVEAAAALLDHFDQLAKNNRTLAVDALCRSDDRVTALLDRLEAGRFSRDALSRQQMERLRNHPTAPLRARAAKLLP